MVNSPLTIREAVAQQIADSAPVVTQTVVAQLANREIDKRTATIITALEMLDKQRKDLAKFKPDQRSLDLSGKVVSETYSQAVFDQMTKATNDNERLDSLIAKALSNGGDKDAWSKLHEQTKAKAPTPSAE